MWYFSMEPVEFLFLCTFLAFSVLVISCALVAIIHGKGLLNYQYQAARLRHVERCLALSEARRESTKPVKLVAAEEPAVMVLKCACGKKVGVSAALALARPGRMIQKCSCGDIVWPPRDSHSRSSAASETRVR